MRMPTAFGGGLGLVSQRLREFFAWWARGLTAGVPGRMKQPFLGSRHDLVLEIAGKRAELVRRHGGTTAALATLSVDEGLDGQLPPIDYASSQLAVEIPDAYLLRRHLEWPLQAEGNLDAAVRFQLHKLIPMSAEDVYCKHRVIRRHRDKGVIELELLVIPRETVSPWLDRLAKSRLSGLVKSLTVKGLEPEVDFLPASFVAGRRRFVTAPRLVSTAVVVLTALALLLPLYKKQRELDLLEADIVAHQQKAEETLKLRQNAEQTVAQATQLKGVVQKLPSRVVLLEELAGKLPDSAYAMSVIIKGDVVELNGEAASSTEVIEQLAASPHFRDVKFAAPVSKNPANGFERFRLVFSAVEVQP